MTSSSPDARRPIRPTPSMAPTAPTPPARPLTGLRNPRRWAAALAVALTATAAACGYSTPGAAPSPDTTTTTAPPTTEPAPETSAPDAPATTVVTGPTADDRERLARLPVEDRPGPGGYVRDLFPTWLDLDGDGCDAREQVLRDTSDPPATVGSGCRILAGRWISEYDGRILTDPATVDVDHVVPLANAWRSGADRWTTDQRAALANDPANLWPASASSLYARRWADVKLAYRLTVTTAERDALGQMFDTCTS